MSRGRVAKRLTSELEAAMLFACRANIERYKNILETHLTDDERVFVQRRLAEEQAFLEQAAWTIVL